MAAAHAVLQADMATVALLSGTVVPLLTGVVTKQLASARLKAIANLVLAVGAGLLAALTLHNGALTWDQIVAAVGQAYIASGITYNHLWKPTGVAAAVQAKTANLGIGPAAEVPPPPPPEEPPVPKPAAAPVAKPAAKRAAKPKGA